MSRLVRQMVIIVVDNLGDDIGKEEVDRINFDADSAQDAIRRFSKEANRYAKSIGKRVDYMYPLHYSVGMMMHIPSTTLNGLPTFRGLARVGQRFFTLAEYGWKEAS